MSDGITRAALALSALEKSDRDWILDQLDQVERDRLEQALREIDAVGKRIRPRPVMPNADVAPKRLDSRQRVVDANSQDMLRVLAPEPDWMVAAICGMYQWCWLPEFTELLGEQRAERVNRHLRTQPDHGAALREALLKIVSQRLMRTSSETYFDFDLDLPEQTPPSRSRLSASLARVANWLM